MLGLGARQSREYASLPEYERSLGKKLSDDGARTVPSYQQIVIGLRLLADHGAQVDMDNHHAKFTEAIIQKGLKTAPSSFKLYDVMGNQTHDLSDALAVALCHACSDGLRQALARADR